MHWTENVLRSHFGSAIEGSRRVRNRIETFEKARTTYSRHATERGQQRGISDIQTALVMTFGTSKPARKGARTYFLDKKSSVMMKRVLGQSYAKVPDSIDIYVIVTGDNTEIVTRCHSIRHHRR